jgi:hypothetical protein
MKQRTFISVFCAVIGALGSFSGQSAFAQNPASVAVKVVINRSQHVAAVSSHSIGLALEVWDPYMTNPAAPKLIKDAGFSILRYPGGSYADLYHWKNNSASQTATIIKEDGFDNFAKIMKASSASALITVNYGSNIAGDGGGEPKEAADWVRYANIVKKLGIKYWEVGNEIYGNGFYSGDAWEVDRHLNVPDKDNSRLQNPALSPSTYGQNVVRYVKAMKAVDPSIKVGAVLATPGDWPDGWEPDWNTNVLKTAGDAVDFVAIHWYGGGKTPEGAIKSAEKIPVIMAKLKEKIQDISPDRAKNIKIWVTEGDCAGFNCQPPGALYAAQAAFLWLENGVDHMNWWDLHNGISVKNDGSYDDQGILSNASSIKGVSEPALNTPFPPYFGLKLANSILNRASFIVKADSDANLVKAHAVSLPSGKLGVLLINEDPATPAKVSVMGLGSANLLRIDRYQKGSLAVKNGETVKVSAGTAIIDLAPYDIITAVE